MNTFARPTTHDQFRASVEMPPDQIDMYGTFSEAGNELLSAANDAMRARTWKERIPDNVLRSTEAACIRTIREIAKYRSGA